MRFKASREDVLASKWWEVKAREVLKTTTTDNVAAICSLIPLESDQVIIELLKDRPDLDTLWVRHRRYQDPSNLTVDLMAAELWRIFQMPQGSGESIWNQNWQLPRSGTAYEIANEIQIATLRVIFRVPLLDFVKCALGYNSRASFVSSLLQGACDMRDDLKSLMRHNFEMKNTYTEVEKLLRSQSHPLAHWIVASSLNRTNLAPYDALAWALDPIKNLFATPDLGLVLKRLVVYKQRFEHINHEYNWDKWSTDTILWEAVYQALWSKQLIPRDLQSEDKDEKLSFLRTYNYTKKDPMSSFWKRIWLGFKKLPGIRKGGKRL